MLPVILIRVSPDQQHPEQPHAAKHIAGAPALEPVVISAPFGNYIQPTGATATLGTFTAERRPGRVWRILKTVRYYRRLKAWVNQIGLRNPGMPWLVERATAGRVEVSDKIVSIHGFNRDQWLSLIEQATRIQPRAIELNMSCPNVGEIDWPDDLFDQALQSGAAIIVKVPPINYELMVEQAIRAGVRAFHCCNTLPVPAGGMSGAPLKPLSLRCIRAIREGAHGEALTLIGGGGIRTTQDIDDYLAAGADRVALGTKTMNPLLLVTNRPIAPLLAHARAKVNAS